MKKNKYPYRSVQDYLDHIGVLERGTAEEIQHARRNFRAIYLKNYRKHYKKFHPSLSISFKEKDKLLLSQRAEENGMKLATFIQRLALDYLNRGSVPCVPHPDIVETKKLFLLCYDLVEELLFESDSNELKVSYERLLTLFGKIEKQLNR
ncbi:hypothetical protein L0P88_13805 [Muricauda sp. SCSIO 64092]|uniref:hypothetical protein n=1 Tax=Allomuricauda sp. SCSIO 64092 TaxID=2908842 RepID=UPI001FF220DB|nr:hypothetical protein [Muricauda sp. SCSIO 64092]UOY05027.1 hypothetical protein L0P88_13805 [Muricauda sp. SCSIO 64092]